MNNYSKGLIAIVYFQFSFLYFPQTFAQDIKSLLTSADDLLNSEEPFSLINEFKRVTAGGVDQFRIQNRLADALLLNREFQEASRVLALQEIRAKNQSHEDRAYYLLNQSKYLYEISDYASARRSLLAAQELVKKPNTASPALTANLNMVLGKVALQQRN
jgi:hypothetical protein